MIDITLILRVPESLHFLSNSSWLLPKRQWLTKTTYEEATMYRIAAALAVLMLFAACHDDGVGMEWGAGLDPSISGQTQMEELTVEWLGTDTAIHKEKAVTVDAGRGIAVGIEVIGSEGTVTDSCSGSAELTEEDYQAVVTQVMAADLPNYEPPAEGDEDCEPVEGLRGMAFVYSFISTSQGEEASEGGEEEVGGSGTIEISELEKDSENEGGMFEVMFETGKCAMESKIQAIATVVEGLAENYITDCTDEIVIGGVEDVEDVEDDDSADAEAEDEAEAEDDNDNDNDNETPNDPSIPLE